MNRQSFSGRCEFLRRADWRFEPHFSSKRFLIAGTNDDPPVTKIAPMSSALTRDFITGKLSKSVGSNGKRRFHDHRKYNTRLESWLRDLLRFFLQASDHSTPNFSVVQRLGLFWLDLNEPAVFLLKFFTEGCALRGKTLNEIAHL